MFDFVYGGEFNFSAATESELSELLECARYCQLDNLVEALLNFSVAGYFPRLDESWLQL